MARAVAKNALATARRSAWKKRFYGQPPEVVAEDQRRRILAEIPRAMALQGYAGLIVEHLIEPAGVSRRTFYDLYDNVTEAFVAVHDEVLTLLCARIASACEGRSDWPTKVSAGISAALEFAAREPLRFGLLVSEPFTAGPRSGYCHERLVERIGPMLRCGRQGTVDTHPPDLEAALIGGACWVVARRLRNVALLPSLVPELVQFVLTPYIGAAEARQVAASSAQRLRD